MGSGTVIRSVGPAALISYAIGGALVILVMRMLGEMSANRPVVGSFMEYARDGLGEWAGFTRSLRSFGETEFWLASIKVSAIVVFLIFGTLYVTGLLPNSTGSVSNLTVHGFMLYGWTAVLNGVAVVIFSYFGTEIVTMAAAESEQPAKSVAKATNTIV